MRCQRIGSAAEEQCLGFKGYAATVISAPSTAAIAPLAFAWAYGATGTLVFLNQAWFELSRVVHGWQVW